MQTEKSYKDDLDYLSQLGFEQVSVSDAEVMDLKKKIRSKSVSFRGIYFSLGSLVMGMIIGGVLFCIFYSKPINAPAPVKQENSVLITASESNTAQKIIELDTVVVAKENFINPSVKVDKSTQSKQANALSKIDSVDVIVSKPLDLSLLNAGEIKEEKLKYLVNSPVFYVHDMKITNYTTLYFKKNRFVKFTGLSAAYSATTETVAAGSGLKQNAEYYLHEEIANAMLNFKNRRYNDAINSLIIVSEFNKNDLNCDFYLAMCYYNKHSYLKAIELFDACIVNTNNAFLQEAMYYKALSLYENDNKNEARDLFKKIALENEFYAAKAKVFLKD